MIESIGLGDAYTSGLGPNKKQYCIICLFFTDSTKPIDYSLLDNDDIPLRDPSKCCIESDLSKETRRLITNFISPRTPQQAVLIKSSHRKGYNYVETRRNYIMFHLLRAGVIKRMNINEIAFLENEQRQTKKGRANNDKDDPASNRKKSKSDKSKQKSKAEKARLSKTKIEDKKPDNNHILDNHSNKPKIDYESLTSSSIDKIIGFLLRYRGLSIHPITYIDPYLPELCIDIANGVNPSFSSEVYDPAIAAQSLALEILDKTYFNRMKHRMEKLDIQTQGVVNIVARFSLRKRNQEALEIDRATLVQQVRYWLADLPIEKNEDQLWVSCYRYLPSTDYDTLIVHRVHYYVIKFARDLLAYGLVNANQLHDFKEALVGRIQDFREFQDTISRLSTNMITSNKSAEDKPEEYLVQASKDLQQIREFYMEIMYHLFLINNDNNMMDFLNSGKSEIDTLDSFSGSFPNEMMRLCMGYALRPLSIKGVDLITGRVEGQVEVITDNQQQEVKRKESVTKMLAQRFLQQTTNVEDWYLQSLWLTKNKDVSYFQSDQFERIKKQPTYIQKITETSQDPLTGIISTKVLVQQIMEEQTDPIFRFRQDLEEILQNYFQKAEKFQSTLLLSLSRLLKKMDQQLLISQKLEDMKQEENKYKESEYYETQLALGATGFINQVLKICSFFIKGQDSEDNQIRKVMNKLLTLCEFAHFKNNINISCFLQESNLELMSWVQPQFLFNLLECSFLENWIAIRCKSLLNLCADSWKRLIKQFLKNDKSKTYNNIIIKALKFMSHWGHKSQEPITKYMASSDLDMADVLMRIPSNPDSINVFELFLNLGLPALLNEDVIQQNSGEQHSQENIQLSGKHGSEPNSATKMNMLREGAMNQMMMERDFKYLDPVSNSNLNLVKVYLETMYDIIEDRIEQKHHLFISRLLSKAVIQNILAKNPYDEIKALMLKYMSRVHINPENNLLAWQRTTLYSRVNEGIIYDEERKKQYETTIDILTGQLEELIKRTRQPRRTATTPGYGHTTQNSSLGFQKKYRNDQQLNKYLEQSESSYVFEGILQCILRHFAHFSLLPATSLYIQKLKAKNMALREKLLHLNDIRQIFVQRFGVTLKSYKQELKHEVLMDSDMAPFPSSMNKDFLLEYRELKKLQDDAIKIFLMYYESANFVSYLFGEKYPEITKMYEYEPYLNLENPKNSSEIGFNKFKRQYLYSNSIANRQYSSTTSGKGYKPLRTHPRKNEYTIYKLQESYEAFKIQIAVNPWSCPYLNSIVACKEEDKDQIANLARFIISILEEPFNYKTRNRYYKTIECICNIIFIATTEFQELLFNESDKEPVTDSIKWVQVLWMEMLKTHQFIKTKSFQDSYYVDQYLRYWLVSKFINLLIEKGDNQWKGHFLHTQLEPTDPQKKKRGEKEYPVMCDTIIHSFRSISRTYQWHTEKSHNQLTPLTFRNREHLIGSVVVQLDILNEMFNNSYTQAQERYCRKLAAQFDGILQRYVLDFNSDFYELKSKAIDYLMYIIQGANKTVCNSIVENYQLTRLSEVMVNSFKIAYWEVKCLMSGEPFTETNIQNIKLTVKDDKSKVFRYYKERTEFSENRLLDIAFNLYNYICDISLVSAKCKNFQVQMHEKAHSKPKKGVYGIDENEVLAYQFLQKNTRTIEYRDEEEEIKKLTFKLPGKCYYLTSSTKNRFIDTVDRTSQQAKINGLMSSFDYFEEEINLYYSRFHNHFWLFQSIQSIYLIQYLLYFLIVAINIMMIIDLDEQRVSDLSQFTLQTPIYVLAYIIIGISSIGWLFWLYSRLRIEYKMAVVEDDSYDNWTGYIRILFSDSHSFVLICYILFCVLGMTVSVILFAFPLLLIATRIQTLKSILRASVMHWQQLLWTFIMQMIVQYFYAFLSYVSYRGRFLFYDALQEDYTTTKEQYCLSILQCWTNFMDNAIFQQSGIGILLGLESYSEKNRGFFYARFFTDVTFYLFINVVFINIIQGIIVDTFDQLREQEEAKEKDMEDVCLICGQERANFVSKGQSYRNHIAVTHNVWNYVYFLMHLANKNQIDCDGVERMLKRKINDKDNSWIPTKQGEEGEEEKNDEEKKGILKEYSFKESVGEISMAKFEKLLEEYNNHMRAKLENKKHA